MVRVSTMSCSACAKRAYRCRAILAGPHAARALVRPPARVGAVCISFGAHVRFVVRGCTNGEWLLPILRGCTWSWLAGERSSPPVTAPVIADLPEAQGRMYGCLDPIGCAAPASQTLPPPPILTWLFLENRPALSTHLIQHPARIRPPEPCFPALAEEVAAADTAADGSRPPRPRPRHRRGIPGRGKRRRAHGDDSRDCCPD